MKVRNKISIFIAGKRLWVITTLHNRLVFASSKDQCISKFPGHQIRKPTVLEVIKFIVQEG